MTTLSDALRHWQARGLPRLEAQMLLLHVLELDDPATVIADVKRRYEAPLMEIFE